MAAGWGLQVLATRGLLFFSEAVAAAVNVYKSPLSVLCSAVNSFAFFFSLDVSNGALLLDLVFL